MMKKQKTSPKQLLRLGLLLPVVAGLLFAFSQPEYRLQQVSSSINSTRLQVESTENNVILTGRVENEFNLPMPGASIIIQGTTIGTIADSDGKFRLELPARTEVFFNKKIDDPLLKFGLAVKMPNLDTAPLIFSYVGYEQGTSSSLKGKNGIKNIDVKMSRSRTYISTEVSKSDVPPPPPPPIPDDKQTSLRDEVFVVVEEMPQYPGGHQALAEYIQKQTQKYMTAYTNDFTQKHFNPVIGFTVSENGSVTNLQILKGSGVEKLTQYAAAIVKGMEDWTPGRQRGKAVPVDYAVRIEF